MENTMVGELNAGRRILVVDDDAGIRTSLSRILRSSGHDLRMASDGFEAVEIAREFHPELVLLDIRMPGIDGVETFQRLRQETPAVAAIFMTAYSSSDRSGEAEERGAIRVLSKPLDLGGLLELVESTLGTTPVLIADDDPAMVKSIARSLEAKGIAVQTATSLREAARVLRQRPERVVIADVFLGDGFGYELLEELEGQSDRPPFVLITGRKEWMEDNASRSFGGEVVCLNKPIDIDELIAKVDRR
jgi:DNA-binding NtrC family response regulator